MLNKEQIKEIIPQREPFLMIDEVEEYIPGESAICYKDVKEEEWYFKGHFPGNPIMPGVLITESLAQAGAIAAINDIEHMRKSVAINKEGKEYLYEEFDKLGFTYPKTYANFIYVDTGINGKELFEREKL